MKMDFERVIGFFGIWFSILMLIWLILHYGLHVM